MRGALLALVVMFLGCKGDDEGPVATACSGSNFQTGSPVLACCQVGQQAWYTYTDPTTSEVKVAQRTLGTPCTTADGGIGCGAGAAMCKFGPCGAAQDWNKASPAAVFVPRSQPSMCGWSSGSESFPEPFSDQVLAPAITGTCEFTRCNTDGTPIK